MAREAKDSPKDRRAIAIRDAAREIVRQEGVWQEVRLPGGKSMRVRSADFENISILYTTPFQPLPPPSNAMKYQAALLGSDAGRGAYLIDVWIAGKKVLFVQWEDDDRLIVNSFRRGDWEQRILDRARDRSL